MKKNSLKIYKWAAAYIAVIFSLLFMLSGCGPALFQSDNKLSGYLADKDTGSSQSATRSENYSQGVTSYYEESSSDSGSAISSGQEPSSRVNSDRSKSVGSKSAISKAASSTRSKSNGAKSGVSKNVVTSSGTDSAPVNGVLHGGDTKTSSASSSGKTTSAPPPFVHPSKLVVGYYGGWAAYGGLTPDKISIQDVDILNYAFAKIGNDNKIAVGDAEIDYTNFNKLKSLKTTYPKLRTVISIGGWNDSGKFSDAALTDSSRAVFADSVIRFMKTYGFDGVDIDWEYPTGGGLASNTTRSSDRTNFGLLLKTLRQKLDEQGIKDHKHYILSFAGAVNNSFAGGVGLQQIAKFVDYAVIMTYDLHGKWDTYSDFNAPLFAPAGMSPQYKVSVDSSVRLWLNYGFPADKLVLGVPFYGYVYQGITNSENGLWERFASGGSVGFDTIKSKYLTDKSYKKYTDQTAQVPWLFNGSTFISYEDETSIQRKAQYALDKNLLGVGVWELSNDKSGQLIHQIQKTLK